MLMDEMKSMIAENSNLYKDKVMDPATPKFFQMLHLLQLIS